MKKQDLAAGYQTILVLWAALLGSQVLFLVLVIFIKPGLIALDVRQHIAGENGFVTAAFALVAITAIIASFVVKRSYFAKAVEQQNAGIVVTGVITAAVLCEVSSLLGLMLAFVFNYPYFYLWIAAGVIGIVLHFPKRDDVFATRYKNL